MGYPTSRAYLSIAGEVKTVEVFDELVKQIAYTSPTVEDSEEYLSTSELASNYLLACHKNGEQVCVNQENARYGEMEEIETAVKKYGLWFYRSTSSDWNIDAAEVVYDPNTKKTYTDEQSPSQDSYIDLCQAERALKEGGPDALVQLVADVRAEADKASGMRLPEALVIADEVLQAKSLLD